MQLLFYCLFCSIFICIGATALIYNYILQAGSGLFFLLWGGMFFLVGSFLLYGATIGRISHIKLWQRYQHQTLSWYKQQFPSAVLSANHVQCFTCHQSKINTYLVKNQSYKVCHYCAHCGEVLFYSDEHHS